jgi:uncharacterized protein YkwD
MKMVVGGTLLACALFAGCGGQDDQETQDSARQELSTPLAATNERDDGTVERGASEAPAAGVVQGGPSTDVLDQLADPDLQALGEGTDSCGAATAIPESATLPEAAQAVLCLVNAERRARGMRRLRSNRRLIQASLGHSNDMVGKRYFAHDTPSGQSMLDRLLRARYMNMRVGFTVGENLAWGSEGRAAPTALVDAWMNSPPHRANILQPKYREIGVGLVSGAPVAGIDGRAVTVTTNFGRVIRASAARRRR